MPNRCLEKPRFSSRCLLDGDLLIDATRRFGRVSGSFAGEGSTGIRVYVASVIGRAAVCNAPSDSQAYDAFVTQAADAPRPRIGGHVTFGTRVGGGFRRSYRPSTLTHRSTGHVPGNFS